MSTTAEILGGLPYFSDLDPGLLQGVCERSEQLTVAPGTVIIEEGTHSEEMYVIAEGQVRVVKRSGSKEVELARLASGDVVGEIALLDQAPRTATVVAETQCLLVKVPVAAFELLLGDPAVVRRMFRTVTSRLRGIETTLRHEERMAALGRMAAQLMHELNNPAAAVGRTSQTLGQIADNLHRQAADLTHALTSGVDLSPPGSEGPLSPLERSEREDDLSAYLEGLGVKDAWDLSPPMVSAGWTRDTLESTLAAADDSLRGALARWTGLGAAAAQLTDEIQIGASRISELVRIVKDYSYVDQAPIQEVDIIKGLLDTLVLLKHKLRDIDVTTEFEPDFPTVKAPGRDLNQIWTNLIDNAADAIDGPGTVIVTAGRDGDAVVVTVADSGSGIPDEMIDKIFDPFFTTKEPGQGTGLGLHTAHTIVKRIGGEMSVESSDHGTTFTVRLPTG